MSLMLTNPGSSCPGRVLSLLWTCSELKVDIPSAAGYIPSNVMRAKGPILINDAVTISGIRGCLHYLVGNEMEAFEKKNAKKNKKKKKKKKKNNEEKVEEVKFNDFGLQNIEVDDIIEWCENVLFVLGEELYEHVTNNNDTEEKKDDNDIFTNVKNALEILESKINGNYLVNDTFSLADIVAISALHYIIIRIPDDEDFLFPKVREYYQSFNNNEQFQQFLSISFSYNVQKFKINPNHTLTEIVRGFFTEALFERFPEARKFFDTAEVALCANPKHGQYQCNSAMKVFSLYKSNNLECPKNPRAVAQAIIDTLNEDALKVVQSTSIAGAGFINIMLSTTFLGERVKKQCTDGLKPPHAQTKSSLKVAVDFSSPNIAKEMHVGHLRSTIIGESVCRMLEWCGHDVDRINHVGDWGTQFGMLIQYLSTEVPDFLDQPADLTNLTQIYKESKKRFDDDAEFKEASRLNVVKLQSGDEMCRSIWNKLCEVSRIEFEKVYKRLDITVHECGESFYNSRIPSVIEELESKNLVTVEDGAKLVFLDHFTYPLIVQKKDGGFNYDSTDMAAIKYRLKELNADWLIYITDGGQGSHFHMVFDAAREAGWLEPENRVDHIGFGVVCGEDGKKFKTRSGETVRLVDLLDEAVNRMKTQLEERTKEGKSKVKVEDIDQVASTMGYGAVRYFDLSQHPATNYKFSYDRMLDTRGNTAIYLLYLHARIDSIISKAEAEYGANMEEIIANDNIEVVHKNEVKLAFKLNQFGDVLNAAIDTLLPTRICDYLYELATICTEFVTNCRVLGSEEQNSRLLLCYATRQTMRRCLWIVGINAIDRL